MQTNRAGVPGAKKWRRMDVWSRFCVVRRPVAGSLDLASAAIILRHGKCWPKGALPARPRTFVRFRHAPISRILEDESNWALPRKRDVWALNRCDAKMNALAETPG